MQVELDRRRLLLVSVRHLLVSVLVVVVPGEVDLAAHVLVAAVEVVWTCHLFLTVCPAYYHCNIVYHPCTIINAYYTTHVLV